MILRFFAYDVWGNEEDGFEVNNVFRTVDTIEVSDEPSGTEIVRALVDQLGGTGDNVRAEWRDTNWWELEDTQTGKPLGRVTVDA